MMTMVAVVVLVALRPRRQQCPSVCVTARVWREEVAEVDANGSLFVIATTNDD